MNICSKCINESVDGFCNNYYIFGDNWGICFLKMLIPIAIIFILVIIYIYFKEIKNHNPNQP